MVNSGGSNGGREGRRPAVQILSIFMQFGGKIGKISEGWRPHLGEILDPPLVKVSGQVIGRTPVNAPPTPSPPIIATNVQDHKFKKKKQNISATTKHMWMHIKLKMYPYGSHEWPFSYRTDVFASDDERSRCLPFPHRKMSRLSESESDGENQTEQHLQHKIFNKMLLFLSNLLSYSVRIL